MKNETLKEQIKQLSRFVPERIILVTEGKSRELTEDEVVVIKEYLGFYAANDWKKKRGMIIKHFSKDSYLDFAFINVKDSCGLYCIYLNLK
jgi:hypothetical protein